MEPTRPKQAGDATVRNMISDGFFHTVIQGRDITVNIPPQPTPVLASLANFEIYMGNVGDMQAQLDLIPEGMWPIIDTIAYGKADDFLTRSGLHHDPSPKAPKTDDVREGLAFLLKVAWERGYFMVVFYRLECIPRPERPVDPMAIMDAIVAEGDPAHPECSLGSTIEATLQRAVSLSTDSEPVYNTLQKIGDQLAHDVHPHLALWCDTVRTTCGYGALAAKAEARINSNLRIE